MTVYYYIYVEGELTLEELVAQVEQSLNVVRKEASPDPEEPFFILYERCISLYIGENKMVDFFDYLDLEDYRYEINLRSLQVEGCFPSMREATEWEEKRARSLFEHLKARGTYRLMLKHSGGIDGGKLDEFIPPAYPQEPSELQQQARTLPPDEMHIFLGGSVPLDEVAHLISRLLETPAQPHTGFYAFRQPEMRYLLRPHNPDLDGIDQGDYLYALDVEARVSLPGGLRHPGKRRYWQYEHARRLYERLKARGTIRLLLASGEERFDEFVPGASDQATPTSKTE